MKKKFDVMGMSCAACKAHVEKAVSKLSGMNECNVNLLSNSMSCNYDETKLNEDDIIKAVVGAGYNAKISEDIKKATDSGLKKMRFRVIMSFVFFIPLFYLSMGHMVGLPIPPFLNYEVNMFNALWYSLAQFILLIPIVIINFNYYKSGFSKLFKGASNMDTLIAIGSLAALVYGIYVMILLAIGYHNQDMEIMHKYHMEIYFESAATILTLVTLGKFFEAMSKKKTTSAVDKLMNLAPDEVIVFNNNVEVKTLSKDVKVNDLILVKPGQRLALDGIITSGSSTIDESAMSGESIPVLKQEGDKVISGTMNLSSSFVYKVTSVGEDTTIAKIANLVSEAANSKAPISKLADKVSGIFVPVVLTIALISFIIWFIVKRDFSFALSIGISVLVISCPCALGLATPVAIMVGTGKGAENGILIKNAESLEMLHNIDTIVLDKTGTITNGKPVVTDFVLYANMKKAEALNIASSLEKLSDHPLAKAIVEYSGLGDKNVQNFLNVLGKGITAKIDDEDYYFGSDSFIYDKLGKSIDTSKYKSEAKTVMLLASQKEIIALFAVRDEVKPSSVEAIKEFHKHGLNVVMLTGDNNLTALAINKEVKADDVIANVLPENKDEVIKKYQSDGHKVMMVGDGINDSIALTSADVGVAIGAGSDIAIDSADVILVKNDLEDVMAAILLSKKVITNIKENLFWAFFYNSIGIPIAAGVFYQALGLKLTPMLGALAMSFSSVCVVLNALRIRRFHYNKEKENNMENIIRVDGMMCENCVKHVKEALSKVPGITGVEIDLKKKKVSYSTNEPVSLDDVYNAVKNAGYEPGEYKEKKSLFKRK